MSYFKPRKVERNYDLVSSCSWYTPDVGGVFAVLGWLIIGMICAGIVMLPFVLFSLPMNYMTLIMYPVQFIPVFMYVRLKSSRNMAFDTGYAMDSSHFGKWGGALLAVAVVVGIIALEMLLEPVNQYLPDTEGSMMEMIEKLLEGPLWVNLIVMCVMAPFFEEWLCRGVVLRGLLNFKPTIPRGEGERKKGLSPALAIVISAIFFAAIHGNVWQGVTAFISGCLLGYVYYKTGSLKLTMLMHCANNTLAVLIGKYGPENLKEAKSLLEVLPAWEFAIIFSVSLAFILFLLNYLRDIPQQDPQGNCDVIPTGE